MTNAANEYDVRRRLRSPAGRLLVVGAAAAVGGVLLIGVARAEAGDGISATGATVDKVGWWHVNNVATSTPATNITVPPPPGVPEGTLAVGAFSGEPDRIAAVGILPEAAAGDALTSFTLTMKEAGPPAAGFNGTAAKIVACPITAFWVGGENGTWDTRPSYDCELARSSGTRAEDGTWTFDLLPIGQAWVDPTGTVAADGIVLVEEVDGAEGFQTVFATSGDGAIVVSLEFESGSTDDELDTGDGVLSGGATGSFDDGASSFDMPAIGSGGIPVGGLPAPEVASPSPGETPQDAAPVAPSTIAATRPNVLGNMPGGVALLVPSFLALLGLVSYSLGPAGEPAAATRQRGVGRALAARAASRGTDPLPTSMETP